MKSLNIDLQDLINTICVMNEIPSLKKTSLNKYGKISCLS